MSKDEVEKTFWTTLWSSVLFIIFGIFLLFEPNLAITIISRCVTLITACIGLFGLYKYFTRKDKEKVIDGNILYSIVAILTAVVVFLFPTIISRFVPIALGVFMIIDSSFKLGFLKEMKKKKSKDLSVCVLIFSLMLIHGIILIVDPLQEVLTMNQSIGMLLTFYSILNVILCFLFKNNID